MPYLLYLLVSLGSITFLTGLLGSSHPPCLSPSFYPTSPPHLTTPYSPTPTQLIASPPQPFSLNADRIFLTCLKTLSWYSCLQDLSLHSLVWHVRPMVIQLLPDAPDTPVSTPKSDPFLLSQLDSLPAFCTFACTVFSAGNALSVTGLPSPLLYFCVIRL